MSDITQAETRLNDEGLDFLRTALISETPISISIFHIGDAYGFFPDPTTNEASGTVVYSGNANQISSSLDASGDLIFSVTLDESIGDFTVGNIMVFASDADSDDGSIIPLWQTVLPRTIAKIATTVSDAGNILVFRTTINIVDGTTLTDVNVYATNEQYGIIPSVATEANLPLIGPSVNPQYTVQDLSGSGGPGLVVAHASDNTWYANAFFQLLDDHRLGWLFGGFAGDGYLLDKRATAFGGFFETGPLKFTKTFDGGDSWAVGTNVLDGGTW